MTIRRRRKPFTGTWEQLHSDVMKAMEDKNTEWEYYDDEEEMEYFPGETDYEDGYRAAEEKWCKALVNSGILDSHGVAEFLKEMGKNNGG